MNSIELNALMQEGKNCSQCVILPFAKRLGLNEKTALKMVKPLESGMFIGSTCGVVSAAYLVIGMVFSDDSFKNRFELKTKVAEFNEKFLAKNKSLSCKELLGSDISSDDNFCRLLSDGTITNTCPGLILDATKILEEMLRDI